MRINGFTIGIRSLRLGGYSKITGD